MYTHKNLFLVIGEWWEQQQVLRHSTVDVKPIGRFARWLPTPGNAIFTLLVIGGLLWAQSAGAISLRAFTASSISTGTIAYQGRLADTGGTPLTGTYNMIFRLYNAASGGVPLWEEQWTGANSVQVSDGLFNVMLGSLTPIAQQVIAANNNLFLGISVGTDGEMSPRVQLGSVPFAVQALTVPDGSITKAKLAADVQLSNFGGRPGSYPYLVHLRNFGLNMGNACAGYVPGDPAVASEPICTGSLGLNHFTNGLTLYASSGNGYIATANNFPDNAGNPRWGYSYSVFVNNTQAARTLSLPLSACNDVAIYVSTGNVQPGLLGDTATMPYHRFPGNSGGDLLGCSCGDFTPSVAIPTGPFRLTFLTRGAQCTYLTVGARNSQYVPVGNWIADNNLTIDWANLRTYLGEQ